MRSLWGRRPRRLIVIAAALFAAAGGIAYATIPGSGGVYTACMLRNIGTIRLIDTSSSSNRGRCTRSETQISWNQQGQTGPLGPAGPQGPKGDSGPKGDQGPSGLSHAYWMLGFADPITITADTVIVQMQPPAGTYLINAKTWIENDGDATASIECQAGGTIGDGETVTVPAGQTVSVSFMAAETTNGNKIGIACFQESDVAGVHTRATQYIATAIDTLTNLGP